MIRVLLPYELAEKVVLPITSEKIHFQYYEDKGDYEQKILDDFWDIVYGARVKKQPSAIFVDNLSALILAIKYLEAKRALEKCRKMNDIMNSSVELQGIRILPILRQLQKLKVSHIEELAIVAEMGIRIEAYIDFLCEGKYSQLSPFSYEAIVDDRKIILHSSNLPLNGCTNIEIPPLRKRKEDIPYMIDHLLSSLHHRYKHLPVQFPDEQTLKMFTSYDWPGNTDELIEIVHLYATGHDITNYLVESNNTLHSTAEIDLKEYVDNLVAKIEKQFIHKALQSTSWNRKKASAIIKMNYKTFCYKMKKYGITRN
ncbi:helix-turn-helix domain-containing protein [Pseudothermotoga sp. U03pept]|uniref:helix-turn-helix domain-containing protein n=1 Tax=Pseudothermotoga sp. U03pept TaxID=3447012 RepID=UPI003F0FE59D